MIVHADIVDSFGNANKQIHERMEASFKTEALREVRDKIDPAYFKNLDQHPLTLVGEQVPSIKGDGKMVTLRDSGEAREWQEAVTQLLEKEVQSVVTSKMDAVRPITAVIQNSIQMLEQNPDMVPNTSTYDQELVNRFKDATKAYEVRVNGGLYGYEVEVQPMINFLREQLKKERAAAPAAAATPPAPAPAAAGGAPATPAPERAPQVGIASTTAGAGTDDGDDWGTFWSAANLPNQIV